MENKKRGYDTPNLKTLKLKTLPVKDKTFLINFIRHTLEDKLGVSFFELKRTHSEKELYEIGLNYFVTSNGTICKALAISQDSGTATREELIKDGLLKTTPQKNTCHYYNRPAYFYTTNPALFEFVKNFKNSNHE